MPIRHVSSNVKYCKSMNFVCLTIILEKLPSFYSLNKKGGCSKATSGGDGEQTTLAHISEKRYVPCQRSSSMATIFISYVVEDLMPSFVEKVAASVPL